MTHIIKIKSTNMVTIDITTDNKQTETKSRNLFPIKKVNAVYTGGNIWLFYGELTDGNYYLTDDDGYTMILDADPENFDESLYDDWQAKHKVTDLSESESKPFLLNLLDVLKSDKDRYMSDEEIDGYREWWEL